MTTLRVTEAAALALVEQADYYRSVSDEELAARWEESTDAAMRSLLRFPERGAPCRFRSPALAGLRWIFVPGFPRHLLFYRCEPDRQTVLVVHVLHGARDLESLLSETE